MLRTLFLLVSLLLGWSSTVVQAQTSSHTGSCADGSKMTFKNWREWTSITSGPVRSQGHNNNWVGIYVDQLAEETYRSASSPYPRCAKIVKPIYADASGAGVRKLTVMMKMAPGYDPENGDWWYGVYDASGTELWRAGKLPECIICHEQAEETDYLFSQEVTDAARE